MAINTTTVGVDPFIEGASKTYLTDLQRGIGAFKRADLSKTLGPDFVAGLDPLQQQAQETAIAGIGGYQPFLQAASASAGPQAYQQFMSPYQKDVIDTTLTEFDRQTAQGLPQLAASAIGAGAFGGGREGVQRAEYLSNADRNRAGIQAGLLQTGFGQAQNLAQKNLSNQLNLGQAGQAFLGQDVGALSTLGGINQAQRQAELSAQQQLNQQRMMQPLTAAQQYGAGITSLISGYPGRTMQETTPTPGAAQTAIGLGSTLAGVYRAFNQPGQLTNKLFS